MLAKNQKNASLGVGAKICRRAARAPVAQIGVLLQDAHERLYAVSTSSLGGGVGEELVLAGSDVCAGRAVPVPGPNHATVSSTISRALCLIELAPDVRVELQTSDKRPLAVASSTSALGTRAHNTARNSFGLVSAVQMPMHVRDTDSGAILDFYGAMEVTNATAAGEFGVPGDAGVAVVNDRNELLGLIVGGVPGCCFVAPLDTLLMEGRLQLAEAAAVAQHNTRVNMKPFVKYTPRRANAEFEAAQGLVVFVQRVKQKRLTYPTISKAGEN